MKLRTSALVIGCAIGAMAQMAHAQELTIKALAFTSLPYYTTTVYNVHPATADSYCTLTGTDALATSYCTTTYQPAYANTMTWRTIYNYDLVEGGGYRYSLLCTASWYYSKCRPMINGEFFKAKVTGSDMRIEGVNGKGKPTHATYHILAVAPIASAKPTEN